MNIKTKENETVHSTDSNCRFVVLGSGCKKCNNLEENVKKALSNLNISESVGHITDFVEIAKRGVMSTPALMIDNKVVSIGKVLNEKEAEKIITENLN